MTGRTVRAVAGAAFLAILLGACGSQKVPEGDPQTLRGHAEQYVALLQAKDEPGLRRHLANGAQPHDAADRIAVYGGRGWALSDVSWDSLTPQVYALSMVVTGPSGKATWRNTVEWDDGHWITAPLNAPPDGAGTQSPR